MRHHDRRVLTLYRTTKVIVALPVVGLLAACAGGPAPEAAVPVATVAPPVVEAAPAPAAPAAPAALSPTPNIPTAERTALAIRLLEQGNAEQARAEINAYLAEIPNSPQARRLLAQIETPVAQLFPAENFTVQLAQNETLGNLAANYLGDVTQFYALARYNDIAVPGRVAVGQTIKIPSTPATLAARERIAQGLPPGGAQTAAAPPPAQAGAPRDPWAIIRGEIAAGRYDAAIREAETARVQPDRAQAAVLASAYAGSARTVRATNAQLAGTLAVRAGELYLETAQQPEQAIEPLQLALMLTPMNARAQTLLATARERASEPHYRAGVQAAQRQDLDGAIAAFDRALAINPEHRNAQLQKAQAQELKANLQRLRPN
jgi:Tfp pilus assembly protein PilF